MAEKIEFRGKIYDNITETVGTTPLIHLRNISAGLPARIVAKVESFNPMNSVKCRVGTAMLDDAERKGILKPGGVVIEPTSGNTGIGLAYACAARGYRLILTMPDSMSIERRKLVSMLGAELVLTRGFEGMLGAILKARELHRKIKGSYLPLQFENPANPQVHRETTAEEIWADTAGSVDILIAGVGTGGTITGTGEVLKQKKPELKVIAVEPESSAVLSGGSAGPHKIQGIGAGFIPKILNRGIIDDIIRITDDEAFETARLVSRSEGILAGISSGAAVAAAIKVASLPWNEGRTIVVILPDSGERYLSTSL